MKNSVRKNCNLFGLAGSYFFSMYYTLFSTSIHILLTGYPFSILFIKVWTDREISLFSFNNLPILV